MSTPKKKSSVRPTRAIQRDRIKRPSGDVTDAKIEEHLTELIHPLTLAQVGKYQRRGLRERILTLPIMMAFVVSLLWRQIGSVREAVRILNDEGILWTGQTEVSSQAVTERLRTLPASLFERVLTDLLPVMEERWRQRSRPLPAAVAWVSRHFPAIVALDGSTLDALHRKVGLLRDRPDTPLAGRMAALLDLASQLPRQVWYEEDSKAHDQRFWGDALRALSAGMLVLFDLGFVNSPLFDELTRQGVFFLTRLKTNAVYRVERVLREGDNVRDCLVRLGSSQTQCEGLLRVVMIRYQGKWYRYLTNVTDPEVLPTEYGVGLYWQQWRIEDAYPTVKRLLGLAYFAVGSINVLQIQLWTTWILYAVLIDLTDAVAEELAQPMAMISIEMVYRGLAHYTRAYRRGDAHDPVPYLAKKAKLLGIIKQSRPKSLDIVYRLTLQLKA